MTKSSVAFVVLLIIALFAALVSSQAFCGGAGYDVTAASQYDLVLLNQGGWNWTVHPCGMITTNALCANETYGSMFCQTSGTTSWSASNYNTSVAAQARWLAITNGVQMSIETGEYCAAARAPREITIQFVCNTTATMPYLSSVTEPEVCWYQAVIQTSTACRATGATAQTGTIGASFWSTQCGGGVYDLTSMSNTDLYIDDNAFSYWIRPCGYVSNSSCANAGQTSFCQKYFPDPTSTPVDLSHWNNSVPQVWTVTDTGVSVNIHDGANCGGQVRQATINFVCNPYITKPRLSFVSEAQICEYVAVIQTPLVCNGRNAPEDGFCGGAGYDLTAIKGLDIQHIYNNYTWYFSPCDQVTVPTICQNKQSMLCQVSFGGAQYSVSSWNRTIAESATWLAISGGVQYSVATGDSCGGAGLREVTAQFICNQTAYAWVESIREPETCWYFIRIHTMYACDFEGTTAPHTPGSSYYDAVCGGDIYDFTNILSQGDLVLDTNTSSATQGYRYYLDLCGQVNFANCTNKPFGETMFCQVEKQPNGNVYSLANYNTSNPAIYTVNTNGVTMSVEDGQPCGGIPERRASIQIICDGTTPARLESVREPETCHYAAVVRGRCDYVQSSSSGAALPPVPRGSSSSSSGSSQTFRSSSSSVTVTVVPPAASSTAPASTGGAIIPPTDSSSSSSSLSGGAIAGIVIGVIAGVFILLAVIAVLCCGACGMGRLKKSSESNYGSGTGKFNEVQETSHVGDSQHGELEMEETA